MDNVREYAKLLIWEGLTEMVQHDAVRENDSERIIRHEIQPAQILQSDLAQESTKCRKLEHNLVNLFFVLFCSLLLFFWP